MNMTHSTSPKITSLSNYFYKYKSESIAILCWILFAVIYIFTKTVLQDQIVTGSLSFIGEVGFDIICFVLAIIATLKSTRGKRAVLGLFAASFFFAIISDGTYNVILNILGIDIFHPLVESLFDIPFLLFLTLQLLGWAIIFRGIERKNILTNLPFIYSCFMIIAAFVLFPTWKINFLSVEGVFNLADTVLEAITFAFVINILFVAKDRRLLLLCFGYLILIASDFSIRFAEVGDHLFAGSTMEATWVLGLMLTALGLLNVINMKAPNEPLAIQPWRSLKAQTNYWFFICFLLAITILYLLAFTFSNYNPTYDKNLPAILIIFALFSAIISNGLSAYLIKPFAYLNEAINVYSSKRDDTEIRLQPHEKWEIMEFHQLEKCLSEGLAAIKKQQQDRINTLKAVDKYANEIRGPLAALQVLLQEITDKEYKNKDLMLEACDQLMNKTNELPKSFNIETTTPQLRRNDITYVIVDDNKNLTAAWELDAMSANIHLLVFNTPTDFKNNLGSIPRDAHIYFDMNITSNQSITGIDLAQLAKNKGFENLYLISGRTIPNQKNYPWIKGFGDKNPPFLQKV